MKTTERLLTAAKDIWDAYNEHPFVMGIQEGTLPKDNFR
ncbi:MAG: thiaminase II, partial [Firmicutes bacterium]|nr:thiaminase II [Bacillota bacterium]